MKLIDEWKNGWKFTSVQLQALGSAIFALFMAWPDAALAAWNVMPAEVKALLPERAMMLVPLPLFIAAMVARFIKQEKLAIVTESSDGNG